MAGSEKTGSGSSARWIIQGTVVGIVAALIVFGVVAYLRGPQEHQVRAAYEFFAFSDEEREFGPNELNRLRVWDIRQASLIPGVAGLGGDGFIEMSVSIDVGDRDSGDWMRFQELGIELYPVGADGTRGEALVPEPESRRTLDELSGQLRGGTPYWLDLEFELPATSVDSYILVLTLGEEEYEFPTERRGRS